MAIRILAFAASLRDGSLNARLVAEAARIAREECGADVQLVPFSKFAMPIYDGDLEREQGLPEGARRLRELVDRCDGLLIASPEYNFSMSGAMKNAFDWVSRARPMPWKGKSALLMSASPSRYGGVRGLDQLRRPFEGCGTIVFPDMFALADAGNAFDDDGRLVDDDTRGRLQRTVAGYVQLACLLAPVCNVDADGTFRREPVARALERESDELQPAAQGPR